MEIKTSSQAGTDESCDILIQVSPSNTLNITVESRVEKLYGDTIRSVIQSTLKDLNITTGTITAKDNGALDYTIRARVKAAVAQGAIP
ncbi:MAG: citrate lyase acyl carrier protein [Candidatus Methanofastidiosia archaeon]|jgi:citrate lyase subunit gamma (acyl carrier protein)